MKRLIFGIVLISCAGSMILAQSGTITSPQANQVWTMNSQQAILWTHSGKAAVRLVLFNPSGAKAGIIKSKLSLISGSFPWSVGKLENGQIVPPAKGYKIQLKIDGTDVILSSSGPFEIATAQTIPPAPLPSSNTATAVMKPGLVIAPGNLFSVQQKLVIHSPKGGDVWKPMANYAITWEALKEKYPASAYDFNVKLVSIDNAAFPPLMLKQHHWAAAKQTAYSNIYTFDWKFLGSMNILSGKYKVTVQSVAVADFKAESGAITVQNVISSDTAFLGEDEPDLLIEDVYYDPVKKSMWARIKNQGFNSYSGPLAIYYQFTLASVTYNTPGCTKGNRGGEAKFPSVTLNKYQSNSYLLCQWPCFDKRPADFFPITGPVQYDVSVCATGKPLSSKTGVICKSKVPDVIVDNHFLLRGKGDPAYLFSFQQASLSPGSFSWISATTFEAKVEIDVRNWGCQGLQCKITLNADGNYLNGQKQVTLGTVNLPSGKETVFVSVPVKFSIPKDGQYHQILLVAHQAEANGEGYPDAYKNNFVLAQVRLEEKSNTIRGKVDW